MSFIIAAEKIPKKEFTELRKLVLEANWKVVSGRDYQTRDVSALVPNSKRAFLIKLPPGGALHPHVDAGDCRTDHYVLETNEGCENHSEGNPPFHMAKGWKYEVNRSITHWAVNNGKTDRIHLLVEY